MVPTSNPPITLLTTTGSDPIDAVLRTVVWQYEQHFPDRIHGYYVEGSYADGTAVPASDLDLRIVFKDHLTQQERDLFATVATMCAEHSPIALDLKAESEADLLRIGAIRFQHATLLIYGKDIRNHVPLKPLAPYIRDTVHGIYPLFARLRGNPGVLTYPLTYPDPSGRFYGYDRRQAHLMDGSVHPSIKDLTVHVLSTATARIAAEAQQYVVTKRDCVPLYQKWINDEWQSLIEDMDAVCRAQWGYVVPGAESEQRRLRTFCEHGLAFQNDFLGRYKDYLLRELQHDHMHIRRFAVQRLGQVVYRDPSVVMALQERAQDDSEEVQQVAVRTLEQYR